MLRQCTQGNVGVVVGMISAPYLPYAMAALSHGLSMLPFACHVSPRAPEHGHACSVGLKLGWCQLCAQRVNSRSHTGTLADSLEDGTLSQGSRFFIVLFLDTFLKGRYIFRSCHRFAGTIGYCKRSFGQPQSMCTSNVYSWLSKERLVGRPRNTDIRYRLWIQCISRLR